MKAFKVFTTALAALCACAIIPTGSVFAAEDVNKTVYPDNFECNLEEILTAKNDDGSFKTAIKDYAVYNNSVALAYNTTVCILSPDKSGEIKHTDFMHEAPIAMLDCDGEGNLYFTDTGNAGEKGKTYLYDTETKKATQPEKLTHDFQELDNYKIDISRNVYYKLNKSDGTLTYCNDGEDRFIGEGYSLLKKYGDNVYAVKDNLPYKIDGESATAISLSYTDYSGAGNIYTGTAAASLSSQNYTVKTAIVRSDAYCTQIDISHIDEKFKQLSTTKTNGEKPCLVLCETGNASIIATNNGCFITATDNLTAYPYITPANDWKVDANGVRTAFAVDGAGVYSTPYMSDSTRIATLPSGSDKPVTVTEKFTLDFLNTTFYRVSFEEEVVDTKTGETTKRPVSGFVAADFLTPNDFAAEDKKPVDSDDGGFKYDTNVTSVILAIIIVGLVLIAILYVTLVGSKKDGKVKPKKKKKQPIEEKQDNYED
ncbi:MAG: hypothetical protein K2N14_05225 [Clostridia bacterium]|nr:hypothetical protein [Clostridia bacterium]